MSQLLSLNPASKGTNKQRVTEDRAVIYPWEMTKWMVVRRKFNANANYEGKILQTSSAKFPIKLKFTFSWWGRLDDELFFSLCFSDIFYNRFQLYGFLVLCGLRLRERKWVMGYVSGEAVSMKDILFKGHNAMSHKNIMSRSCKANVCWENTISLVNIGIILQKTSYLTISHGMSQGD